MKLKRIIYLFLIFLSIGLITPYVKVEILTKLYGTQFKGLEIQTGFLKESEYLKVFKYGSDKAKVYYVEKNHSSGNMLYFDKVNNSWQLDKWDTVWSYSGSADGIIWPYYP